MPKHSAQLCWAFAFCADLSELFNIDNIIPVVIFLQKSTHARKELHFGTRQATVLDFRYFYCSLAELNYLDWRESENRVAVLNLPCMQYAENEKYAMFHDALSQFVKLEPRRNKLEKYVEMVHYYSKFDEQDYEEYERQYPQEDETMKTFSQIFTEKGMQAGKQEGMQQGMQQGIKTGELSSLINTLLRLLSIRFGEVPQQVNEQVKQAETEQLNRWIDRVVVADSLESVFA